MKTILVTLAVVLGIMAQTIAGERISFNEGWRFTKLAATNTGTNLNYSALRPWILPTGNAFTTNAPAIRPEGEPAGDTSFARPDLDDSQWRLLNLPHDWGIEGPFKQEYPGETGKLPWWGVACYRKHLVIPATDAGRKIFLEVDGAMAYASVWLNGKLVGGWPYGYASWRVDLTPFVNFGADNLIAIRLDNPPKSSRWYPGGGIYRNVWLEKDASVHVAQWGVFVTTPAASKESAMVKLAVNVENSTDTGTQVRLKNEIFELKADGKRGKSVASVSSGPFNIPAQSAATNEIQTELISPKLWSLEKPRRYMVVTTVEQNGKVVDVCETPFGIRTFSFTVGGGFFLNGRHVKLNGVCDHHDLGALGAALNVRALERQLQILKEFGVNAIRTSHNPPAQELLDLCDRMGFLVMDEAFDCWAKGKNKNDYQILYPDWHERDLRALVRRDRNHPSVILWSSGNEVPDQDKPGGPALAEEHRAIIHSEDATRPVTAAVSSLAAGYSGFQNHFDVFGWNYHPTNYAQFRATNANIPMFGSETASTVSSRGEYFFPPGAFPPPKEYKPALVDFQVSSYDNYAPHWATLPDTEFRAQEENPFIAGEFVWTGFDYLGEPTPYGKDATNMLNFSDPAHTELAKQELAATGKIKTPSRSSYFGIVDLAGFKKDRFYLYQAHWRPHFPMAHILPHWTWPERTGRVTPVYVYTSGDSAELFLNGKSLGRRSFDSAEFFLNGKSLGVEKTGGRDYRLRWDDVVYEPGTLKVVAYKHGKKWATDEVQTAGDPAKLTLTADRSRIAADGRDLSFITVSVRDKNGILAPRAGNHVKFSIQGPGEIVATDNGDPTSFESFQAPERHAFNGLALVIVRGKIGGKGEIVLKAESPGLKSAEIKLKSF